MNDSAIYNILNRIPELQRARAKAVHDNDVMGYVQSAMAHQELAIMELAYKSGIVLDSLGMSESDFRR